MENWIVKISSGILYIFNKDDTREIEDNLMSISKGIRQDHVQHSKRLAIILAAHDLLNALEKAKEHLEYCGYGDNYERESAYANSLPSIIEAAIEKAKGGVKY